MQLKLLALTGAFGNKFRVNTHEDSCSDFEYSAGLISWQLSVLSLLGLIAASS